jgi:hypothetical protein
MNNIIGQDVIRIDAPQDRSELVIEVLNDDGNTKKVRFSNDDGTKIQIDFSAISISLIYDPDTNNVTMGELEELNEIEDGFEVVGDFGIIWIKCKKCIPWQ